MAGATGFEPVAFGFGGGGKGGFSPSVKQLVNEPPLRLFDSPSILDELARIKAHLGLDRSRPAFADPADEEDGVYEIDPVDPAGLGGVIVAALGTRTRGWIPLLPGASWRADSPALLPSES